jgi:hypothetical protein
MHAMPVRQERDRGLWLGRVLATRRVETPCGGTGRASIVTPAPHARLRAEPTTSGEAECTRSLRSWWLGLAARHGELAMTARRVLDFPAA